MNAKRKKLLMIVIVLVLGVGTATTLALKAFQENLMYFYSPSQVERGEAPTSRSFRIGGLVTTGSVKRNPENLKVSFDLTDTISTVTVQYEGILPDLFREGQGIVANGSLGPEGKFIAAEVLAKHDENYMPAEVADALDKAGVKHDYSKKEQGR